MYTLLIQTKEYHIRKSIDPFIIFDISLAKPRLGRRARLEATIKINEERYGNIRTDTKLSANLDRYEAECDVGISRPIRSRVLILLSLCWFGLDPCYPVFSPSRAIRRSWSSPRVLAHFHPSRASSVLALCIPCLFKQRNITLENQLIALLYLTFLWRNLVGGLDKLVVLIEGPEQTWLWNRCSCRGLASHAAIIALASAGISFMVMYWSKASIASITFSSVTHSSRHSSWEQIIWFFSLFCRAALLLSSAQVHVHQFRYTASKRLTGFMHVQ